MAIVEGQKALLPVSNRNKAYLKDLGYDVTKDKLEVEISDLPKASTALVKFNCDYCGTTQEKKYRQLQNTKTFCNRKCADQYLLGKPGNRLVEYEIITCDNCSNKFERAPYDIKKGRKNQFCSRACADEFLRKYGKGRPKVERVIISCPECGVEFRRREKYIETRGENCFCSKPCADKYKTGMIMENRRTGKYINCGQCGNEHYLPKNRIEKQERFFCSNECYHKWQKESGYYIEFFSKNKTGQMVQCSNSECNNEFYRMKCEIEKNKQHYCSKECFNKDRPNWNLPQCQKGERIEVNCYCCGKLKEVIPSILKKNKYFFCSFECYQGKRIEITEGLNTATSIHLKITDLLENIKVNFIDERHCGYYNLDIYLTDYDLFIEIMGDYWHSNPNKYKLNEINEIQARRIVSDKRKNTFMKNHYKANILYLWETDINDDIDLCLSIIKNFIQSKGILNDYQSYNYVLSSDDELLLKDKVVNPYFLE